MSRSLFAAKLLQGIRTKASRSEGGKENKEILTAAEQAWGAHSQTQPASSHLRFPGNTSLLLRHGWVPLSLTMKMHPVETMKGIPGSAACSHFSHLGWEETAGARISLDLQPGSGLKHYYVMRL